MPRSDPGIALIGTLDTKGAEIAYVRDRLLALGVRPLVVDSGILGEPDGIEADVTRAEARPTPLRTDGATETATARARQARAHYDQATEAQQAGDWARYGEELQKLGALLEEMANGP